MRIVNFGVKQVDDVMILMPNMSIDGRKVKIEYDPDRGFLVSVGCQENIVVNEKTAGIILSEIESKKPLRKTVQCIISNGGSVPTADQVLADSVYILLEETQNLWISTNMKAFDKSSKKFTIIDVTVPCGDYFSRSKAGIFWKGGYKLSEGDVTKIRKILEVIIAFYAEGKAV